MANRNQHRGYARQRAYYSANSINRRENSYRSSNDYVYGSAAPAYEPDWEEERRDSRGYRTGASVQERPRYQAFMNPAMITSLLAVILAMSFVLIQYISLQSDVTASIKEIAQLESSLSDLKSNNDELENEINSNVNLDDIKYTAITKLGMTYAQEDQIVNYDGGSGDYVRQVTQLGQ